MATQIAKQTCGAPSPETMTAMDDEDKAAALRQACFSYEANRRDLEDKFGTALSTLREQYLAQVLEIHGRVA